MPLELVYASGLFRQRGISCSCILSSSCGQVRPKHAVSDKPAELLPFPQTVSCHIHRPRCGRCCVVGSVSNGAGAYGAWRLHPGFHHPCRGLLLPQGLQFQDRCRRELQRCKKKRPWICVLGRRNASFPFPFHCLDLT